MMNTLRLLLIEDSADDAFLLMGELERAGYELTCRRVENERGVAEALAEHEWDLVICDYALPGYSGRAALDLVRRRDADLPFIIVSGTIGEETAVEVMLAGANDYVLKGRLGRLGPAVAREMRDAALRRERRQLMDEVLRSEERFRATFEHAPIGITHSSADGVLLRVNHRFCHITGYAAEELVGRCVAASHADDVELVLDHHSRITSGASEVECFESRYTRKDGSVLWANVTLAAIRDEEGSLRHVLGLFQDVTEQRTTSEQLRFQARLLECVEQAVVATDLRGRVQYWNQHAETLYGVPPVEAMGRRVLELVRPVVSREEIASAMTVVSRGATWSGELALVGRNGVRPVTVTNSPVTDAAGAVIGCVGVSQDVSARRAAEQALLESRAQLALAQQFTRVGSAEYDYATGRRTWSDEMFRLFGLEPAAEPPPLEDLLTYVEDDDRDALGHVLGRAIERMEGFVLDYGVRLPDGRHRVLRSQARVISGRDGEPVKLLGVVQDVTDQKALEDEMLRHSERHEAIANFSQSALGGSAIETLFAWANLLLRTIGEADLCEIAQITDHGLLLVSGEGWLGGVVGKHSTPLDESLAAGYAVVSSEAVVVEDFDRDDRFDRSELLRRHGVRSGVTVAIPGRGEQIWGVLSAYCARPRSYSANEVNFLRAVANILGYAIQRKETEEELRGLAAQQAAIAELGSRAVSAVDHEIVEHACSVVRRVLAAEHSCFLLRETEMGVFSHAGGNRWTPPGLSIPCGPSSHAGYTLAVDAPVVVDDYSTETRFELAAVIASHGLVSGATVPVKGGSCTYGVLAVQTREQRAFSARDVDFLQSIANIVADVLERETARRALLESEARYRSVSHELELLLESTEEGIYAVHRDGTCRMANPAAARLLGYAQHELVGRHLHDLVHSRRPDGSLYPEEECPLRAVAKTGTSCRSTTDTFWRRDGSPLMVEYAAAPIIDDGVIKGVVVTFTDVTEQRKLESQLEQATRLTSLGHLAATIAHEFNNVLMGISPFVELLSRSPEQTPQLRLATEQMSRAIRRGKGVTNEILRFTRSRPPVLESVAVREWLQSLATEARSVVGDLYDVKVSVEPHNLTMSADADQLHQVFLNLIVNARDAMPDGGRVSISARRDGPNARYTFGAVPESDQFVHFTVTDTGSGMTRDMVRHIFEPLYTTKKNGTGLGLAVTHQVINRHGGHVFVESTVGVGTTFHLFILLSAATQEAGHSSVLAVPQHAAIERVLLVEDEEAVAAGMAALLELHGIAVTTIGTAAGVLDAISGDGPDAVILDIGLPDGDGTQIYPAIAKMYPRLPVIFSTGRGDEQKLERFLASDNVRFLMKPYEIEALLDVLSSVVPARLTDPVN